MRKTWIVLSMLVATQLPVSARAQYTEVWSLPPPNGLTLASLAEGHTQQGVSRQFLCQFYDPNSPNSPTLGLRLLDGATGQILWSVDEQPGQLRGCELVDVDGDGYDEVLYWDAPSGATTGQTFHVVKFTGPAAIGEAPAPSPHDLMLSAPRPNPTRNRARIDYQLPAEGQATVAVYSVQGQLVRTLEGGQQHAGPHSTAWDGLDASGRVVPSGAYFYVVKTPAGEQARKAIMLR